MPTIHCSGKLLKIGTWVVFVLPKGASAKLPSRGMVMVEGTIHDIPFRTVLEPDGKGSHWLRFTTALQKATGASAGDAVTLAFAPTDAWVEPEVPADVQRALAAAPKAHALWKNITPNARWDWVRWIRSTKDPETRQRRIMVACSKLKSGMRRPCCFNRNACCEPEVSKNGMLAV